MTTPTHQLESVNYKVSELATYHRNPRRGDIDAIADSLEVNGQYRAIVVNLGRKTGRPLEVLAGNHTLKAARKLGWETITATTVDVDDKGAARIVAADNRTADLGDYDMSVLSDLLVDLEELDGTGYEADDLTEMLDELDTDAHHETDIGAETALIDVTFGEPTHQPAHGEIWHLTAGAGHHHVLVIAKLADEHETWSTYLAGRRFNPYPDPYITAGNTARETPLLLVQPNLFLAGHLLDKHATLFGATTVTKVES